MGETMRTMISSIFFGLLFSVSAIAAETSSIVIFTPEGRLLTRQQVTKIYEVAKECERKSSAAAPVTVRAANKGGEDAKAGLTVIHAICMRWAVDDILAPSPPFPPEEPRK